MRTVGPDTVLDAAAGLALKGKDDESHGEGAGHVNCYLKGKPGQLSPKESLAQDWGPNHTAT